MPFLEEERRASTPQKANVIAESNQMCDDFLLISASRSECAICISFSGMFHRTWVRGLSMAVRHEAIGERFIRSRSHGRFRTFAVWKVKGKERGGEVGKKAIEGGLGQTSQTDTRPDVCPLCPPLPSLSCPVV